MEIEQQLLDLVSEYISRHYVDPGTVDFYLAQCAERPKSQRRARMSRAIEEDNAIFFDFCLPPDGFKVEEETFSEMLFFHIDRLGLKDSDVYKKAKIDRKLFSKIRSDINYKPSKKTALSLCISLELNIDDTLDLIGKAGFTLSRSNKGDLIVRFFIEHEVYDLMAINQMLEKFDQPILNY